MLHQMYIVHCNDVPTNAKTVHCNVASTIVAIVLLFYVLGRQVWHVMSGLSVNLTTLFLDRLRPPKRLTSTVFFLYTLSPVTDNCPSSVSRRRKESIWPDRVSSPGPLALESDLQPTALRVPALIQQMHTVRCIDASTNAHNTF